MKRRVLVPKLGFCLGSVVATLISLHPLAWPRARGAPARIEGEAEQGGSLANEASGRRALEETLIASWNAAPFRGIGEGEVRARRLVAEAKRLIVDSFPEDRQTAENLLIDAIRVSPRHVDAYADLSRYLLWQIANGIKEPAEIQRATQLAAHVREIASDRPVGNYLVCEVLLALGQSQQASKLYQDTAKRWPDHVETKVFEARYWSENDPARALVSAQDALGRGHPMDDLSPAIALAVTTREKKSGRSVGDGLGRFASVYPDRWLWHRAAMAFADENRREEARGAYLKAVALGNGMESRLQLGVLEYTVLHRLPDAARHLEEVRVLLEKRQAAGSESAALVLCHLALALLEAGDEKRASDAGGKALLAGMQNNNIIVPLTEEFLRRKKGELLRKGLEAVAVKNPMQEYVHVTLANLASERKDFDDASDRFSAAIALSPTRDDLLSARGHVAYRALRYDAALRDFDRASRMRPDQSTHHYNKACMLSLLGRRAESIVSLREAIALNSDLSALASRDTDLAPLRDDSTLTVELAGMGIRSGEGNKVPGDHAPPTQSVDTAATAKAQTEAAEEGEISGD